MSKLILCGLIAATVLLTPTAQAQTQTKPDQVSQAAIATGGDNANITIFSRKRLSTQEAAQTRIPTGTASSCGFMSSQDTYSGNAVSNYMDDFYGPNRTITDPSEPGGRFRYNSPLGDASTGSTFSGNGGMLDGCTPSDYRVQAGRAYIAQHYKGLQKAFAAYDAQDYPTALRLFQEAYSTIGYPIAALMEGEMYLFGVGTAKDPQQAITWLRKVAEGKSGPDFEQGFDARNPYHMSPQSEASVMLARIYSGGMGIPEDKKQVVHWYNRAATYGYLPAVHTMGRVYETGFGGETSLTKAMSFYKKAGQGGYAPSQYALGQIYYSGDEGVPQDKTRAGAWLQLAAKNGHPDALYAVGRMYELGEGGASVDAGRALIYYKEAAVKGQPDAQNVIATDFYTGTGLPKDLTYARKWFEESAKRGNPDAMFNLAAMMVKGEGGPKDLVKAYCWFSVAQKGGHEKAGEALKEVSAKMTPEDRAAAEALLNPPAKS